MGIEKVQASYSDRAQEYIERFGSMESVHPADRQLISQWASSIIGSVIDVGCGPGQWTDHLGTLGCDVRGVDPTAPFVEHARATFPARRFDLEHAENLSARSNSVAGVLAWYSLIHHEPNRIRAAFDEFARVLRPGGRLLIGFFEGPELRPFDHAVVTAYHWPVSALSDHLDAAGFDVVGTQTRAGLHHRPHGAISAVRSQGRATRFQRIPRHTPVTDDVGGDRQISSRPDNR